jgi:para-nitrobenzyl esterase
MRHPCALGGGRRYARRTASILAIGALVTAMSGTAAASTRSPQETTRGLVVATGDGVVRGITKGSTDEFLGLPYAAPPVGKLRWQPPHHVISWKGVRSASAFAPHCAQPASQFGLASSSENCLYLNVYSPAHTRTDGRPLPVMVWIHGGAFIWGESNDYNPANLVSHGVIVVTINYRLGALGFLADSALAGRAGGPSGNYGLMDQQAALRWVQHNISRFGGSPHRVTLAGESSGGLSVLAQLASRGAHGLFSRAIVESGAYDLKPQSLAAAEVAGATFAEETGCSPQTAACLRALPVATILKEEAPAGYRPDIDGRVLTQTLAKSFASGRFNRVPVINGSNRDEYRLFVGLFQEAGEPTTATDYPSLIESVLHVSPAVATSITARYPLSAYPSPALAFGAVGTDATFACPALAADRSLSKYVPTYAYEFNDLNAPERYLPPLGFPYGAAHESEVQYLFTLNNTPNPGGLTAAQNRLAKSMQRYWTNLVKHATPTGRGEPSWPRFNRAHRMLSLDTPQPTIETNFAVEHNCAFWAQHA